MTDTEQTERLGVSITESKVLQAGHIFRSQTVSDFGIDAQIEIKAGVSATGRLIAVQIKSGKSYFSNEGVEGFWLNISDRHRDMWVNHSLPVIVVLCDVDIQQCYFGFVNEETCIRAGESWKIHIAKSQILDADSSPDLISIASPVAAASDYSIHEEQDVSHALARRISLHIVLHPGVSAINRPLLGAIIRSALRQGQTSDYHRDQISFKALAGRPVDVVWGFLFLRDVDRQTAAWACRFQWISPFMDASNRPIQFIGEQDGTGLVIDWKGNTELAKFLDDVRASKAAYLKQVDLLLAGLPTVHGAFANLLHQDYHGLTRADFADEFCGNWNNNLSPPVQCQRLNQAMQQLLALVGNVGLVWKDRHLRNERATRSLMQGYFDQLNTLEGEIEFLRRDVR